MRLNRTLCWAGSVFLVALTACQDSPTTAPSTNAPSLAVSNKPKSYVISLADGGPSDLASRVVLAGGKLKKASPEAGVATAQSDAADFASKMRAVPGVEGVAVDRVIRWVDPNQRVVEAAGPGIGSDETFFNAQWNMLAIKAPQAWNRGARGRGVRVAVLDGGLNADHIDLAGNVDVACSASMVDGFNFNQDVNGFSHATHVSGIIAAKDNAIGTIGVAPEATIIGVKVLQNGSGSFGDVIDGIMYAADPKKPGCKRADVINMSLGATFEPAPEDRELIEALNRATRFAHKKGVVVIASAGNDGLNLDQNKKLITIPAQSDEVIAVSATGPVGFALGATNFDHQASYTNFGRTLVDLAGPGGDFILPGDDICQIPRIPASAGFLTNFCWVFDMVLSPASIGTSGNGGYFFAAGTSMAAPAVAGVAALVIERRKGPGGRPDDVFETLKRTADHPGGPGGNAVYGFGRVNADRASR